MHILMGPARTIFEAARPNEIFLAPDVRFGLSANELQSWLEDVGPEGRQAYEKHAWVDLVVFTLLYSSMLSVLLARLLQKCHISSTSFLQHLLLLPSLAMLCDVAETASFIWAARAYPERIHGTVEDALPWCQQGKWCGVGLSILSVLLLGLTSLCQGHTGKGSKPATSGAAKKES